MAPENDSVLNVYSEINSLPPFSSSKHTQTNACLGEWTIMTVLKAVSEKRKQRWDAVSLVFVSSGEKKIGASARIHVHLINIFNDIFFSSSGCFRLPETKLGFTILPKLYMTGIK